MATVVPPRQGGSASPGGRRWLFWVHLLCRVDAARLCKRSPDLLSIRFSLQSLPFRVETDETL